MAPTIPSGLLRLPLLLLVLILVLVLSLLLLGHPGAFEREDDVQFIGQIGGVGVL